MQALWRSGYEANSVKAMAERLGVTRSSYYNAFGSREALFEEALKAYFEQSPDRRLHQEPPASAIKALLTDILHEICRQRAQDPEGRGCLAINSLCELAGGPHHALAQPVSEALLLSVDRLEQLLTIAVDRAELPRETDIRAKAMALQTLIVGVNVMSKAIRDEAALWSAVKTSLEALDIYQET